MNKTLLQEVKAMNKIAGTQMTKAQEIAFIKNRLQELEFTNQASFDAYKDNHKLKPDTKVKIAGKETTAADASKKPGMLQKLGAKLFGKKEEPTIPKLDPKNPLNKKGIYDPKRGSSVTIGKILSDPEKYKHLIPDVQAAIDTDPTGAATAKHIATKKASAKKQVEKLKQYNQWREDNPEEAAKQDKAAADAREELRLKQIKSDEDKEKIKALALVGNLANKNKKFRNSGLAGALSTALLNDLISSHKDDKKDGEFGGFGGGAGAGGSW